MTETILIEIDSGVGLLTLNRPEVGNRLDAGMQLALYDALAALKADKQVRLVVIGAQGKAFCQGASTLAAASLEALQRFPKPILARVQGEAIGFGVALIAGCDIALATIDARFMLRDSVPLSVGERYLLARTMGERQARRFLLTGEVLSAVEARRLGLIDEIVADEVALDEALAGLVDAVLASDESWRRQLCGERGELLCSSS